LGYVHRQRGRAGRQIRCDDPQIAGHRDRAIVTISFAFYRKGRYAGALFLERADWAGAAALPMNINPISYGGFPDPLTPVSAGAHWQSRRS